MPLPAKQELQKCCLGRTKCDLEMSATLGVLTDRELWEPEDFEARVSREGLR